jgi:hypothetical protein
MATLLVNPIRISTLPANLSMYVETWIVTNSADNATPIDAVMFAELTNQCNAQT